MEYDKAFQVLRERGASRHIIMAEDPNLVIAIDTLVQGGTIVGQGEILTEDVIYYLNPEKDNRQPHINSNWTVPTYATQEERLKRPTELKNGVTRNFPSDEQRLQEVRRQLENVRLR